MYIASATADGRLGQYSHKRGDQWIIIGHAAQDLAQAFQAGQDLMADPQTLFGGGLLQAQPQPGRGEECRVILMNGVGTGYGDLLCGSVAIRELYRKLDQVYGWKPKIMICCMPCHLQQYVDIFGRDPHVAIIQPAGVPIEVFEQSHFIGTTEGLIADPAFNRNDMIQYFLGRFGVSCPKHRKVRIYPDGQVVKAIREAFGQAVDPPVCLDQPGKKARKTCLLNFWASGYRRLPFAMFRPLAEILMVDGWRIWLTSDPRGRDAMQRWKTATCHPSEPIHDVSELVTQSWSHFVGVASCADLIVSPDTSLIHVAGALEKPCVGIFYSIEPILRINRYPTVVGFCGDNFRRGPLWGLHRPPDDGKFNDAALDTDRDWTESWRHCDIDRIKAAIDKAVSLGEARHAKS